MSTISQKTCCSGSKRCWDFTLAKTLWCQTITKLGEKARGGIIPGAQPFGTLLEWLFSALTSVVRSSTTDEGMSFASQPFFLTTSIIQSVLRLGAEIPAYSKIFVHMWSRSMALKVHCTNYHIPQSFLKLRFCDWSNIQTTRKVYSLIHLF